MLQGAQQQSPLLLLLLLLLQATRTRPSAVLDLTCQKAAAALAVC
jgi:hypothetical protein